MCSFVLKLNRCNFILKYELHVKQFDTSNKIIDCIYLEIDVPKK